VFERRLADPFSAVAYAADCVSMIPSGSRQLDVRGCDFFRTFDSRLCPPTVGNFGNRYRQEYERNDDPL
jgi:hypothetical protein